MQNVMLVLIFLYLGLSVSQVINVKYLKTLFVWRKYSSCAHVLFLISLKFSSVLTMCSVRNLGISPVHHQISQKRFRLNLFSKWQISHWMSFLTLCGLANQTILYVYSLGQEKNIVCFQ